MKASYQRGPNALPRAAFAFAAFAAVAAKAATAVTSDVTQNGGTYDLNTPTELIVSGSTLPIGPTLKLAGGATTAGVQGLVIGTSQAPFGSAGNLRIEGGSSVTNSGSGVANTYGGVQISKGSAYVGLNALSTGTATVTGGSAWTNAGDTSIGHAGLGTLAILDGGAVADAIGAIGTLATGSGSVSVAGPGSAWANSTILGVGLDGFGTLAVSSGGTVTAGQAYVGFNTTGVGQASVAGGGSLKVGGDLRVGHLGRGTLDIGSGGLVEAGGVTTIGTAASRINLSAGGTLRTGGLGFSNDPNRLNWTGGTIEITSASQSIGTAGNLGPSLTVGPGKTLNFTGPAGQALSVLDTGTLGISGGYVRARSLSLPSFQSLSLTGGTLEVSGGSLSYASSSGVAVAGQNPTLRLSGGATTSGVAAVLVGIGVNPSTGATGPVGSGTLRVESGSTLSSGTAQSSNATITVTGNGSAWHAGDLLALGGNTVMNVEAGGAVDAVSVGVGDFAFNSGLPITPGGGTLNVSGGAALAVRSLGVGGTNGDGTLSVQSGAQLSMPSGTTMFVGSVGGNGTVNVGGLARLARVAVATVPGKTAAVNFVGSNSTTEFITLGGVGSLDVSAGSRVRTATLGGGTIMAVDAGLDLGSANAITVRDPGTRWTIDEGVRLGVNGRAVLTISNGGRMTHEGGVPLLGGSTSGVIMAANAGSSADATVTGTGSIWSIEGNLVVGAGGTATLRVEKGGALTSGGAGVGNATATVVDAGSTWTVSALLSLFSPNSVVSIGDGGRLSAAGTNLGPQAAGARVNLRSGGTFTVNTLDLAGDAAALNWNGGVLKLAGGAPMFPAVTDTGLHVPAGGTLTGVGTVGGNVVNAGVVEPGDPSGLMTVSGSLAGVGRYVINIQSSALFGQIGSGDSLTFDGSVIAVDLLPGYTPVPGDSFDLFNFPDTIGGTWTFDFSSATLPAGLAWDTGDFAATGVIGVAAVPEPSAAFAAVIGAGTVLSRRRRRRVVPPRIG